MRTLSWLALGCARLLDPGPDAVAESYPVNHGGGQVETKVFGADVKVSTGPVTADIDERTGTLNLVYTTDGWRTCLGILGL